jgi:hypothetical protein
MNLISSIITRAPKLKIAREKGGDSYILSRGERVLYIGTKAKCREMKGEILAGAHIHS